MENKTITIELKTGEKVGLMLTFSTLYALKAKHKENYEKYNNIVMDGIKDMLDYPVALYTAYLCKCEDEGKEPEMTEMEFIEKLPYALSEVVEIYRELFNAEKKMRSENRLGTKQEG